MTISFDNLFSIRGKVALVTGGSRGIGEMIAAGYLSNGAKVYISSRKADACEATAKRLVEAYVDCDGDTLLLKVDQMGPACHTGAPSCFFRKMG